MGASKRFRQKENELLNAGNGGFSKANTKKKYKRCSSVE